MQRCHNYKINCGVKISKEHCRGSGQGGCERRIEVFVKIQKTNWGGGGGGQGGCERRIEVFVKIRKKIHGGSGLGGGGSGWMWTKN